MEQQNLFIDGGAHLGEAFEHFSKIFSPINTDYVLYEPNIDCYQKLVDKYKSMGHITIINKAIYVHNNTQSLYVDPNKFTTNVHENDGFSVGCSLLREHNDKHYASQPQYTVQCQDIIDIINDARTKYNNIILKLDVEGSEYDILEKCIEHDVLKHVSYLVVEFHSQYTTSNTIKEREETITKYLKDNNINHMIWH